MPNNWLADLEAKVAAMSGASQEYPWIAYPLSNGVEITCYGDNVIGMIHADEDPTDPNRELGNDAAGIVALRNAAPRLLAEARKVERLEHEIRNANRRNHERNVAMDALHYVWCSGGCESGTHRFGDHPPLTEEIARAAVDNTRRLVQHFENAEHRKLDNAGVKAKWEHKERLERIERAARAYVALVDGWHTKTQITEATDALRRELEGK